ncbi:MAG: flagellar motor switch protein FliM [Burkholderiales bacterium]|nr:flagellar motor switch protein FliM [Burkholderiales bacterium]
MADDILSQEEVDALLRGVTGEPEDAPESEPTGGVRDYDIGRQERIVRGRMPTLELINERFARLFRIALFNFMRRNAEIGVNPVRVVKYSDFIRNLVVPTNLNVIQAKPLRGLALVIMEPTLVFQVVDHLFGGTGQLHTRIEGRDFTPTEQRVIQRLLDVVFEEFKKSWAPVYPLEMEFVRSEMNTQFANIATPTEIVVATSFSIDLGSGSGELHVCMPYSMLEPIRDLIYSSFQADRNESDSRWVKMLTEQVQSAEVEVVATLAETRITLREITTLEVGDVIPLDLPPTVVAKVDGVPLLDCQYGVIGGNYALKVRHVLTHPDSPE